MKSEPLLRLLLCIGLLTLCLVILLSSYIAVRNFSISTGINLQGGQQGLIVMGIEPGAPADRAGIREGDLVISIADHSILAEEDYDKISRLFKPGHQVKFIVERDSREYILYVEPGEPVPLSYFLLSVVIPLLYFGVAIFILRRRSGYLRANLFGAFCIVAAFEVALPPTPRDYPLAGMFIVCILYILNGVEFGVTLHFASVFPERRRWLLQRPWIIKLYYIVGIGFALLVSLATVSESLGWRVRLWAPDKADFVFTSMFLPLWSLALVLSFGWSALRYTDQSGRRESLQLLLGTLPWAVFVISTAMCDALDQLLPPWVPEVGTFVLIFYPMSVLSILVREVNSERAVLLGLSGELGSAETLDKIVGIVIRKIESTLYPSRVLFWWREGGWRNQGLCLPDNFLQLMQGTELFGALGRRGKILDTGVLSLLISDREKEALDSLGVTLLVPVAGDDVNLVGFVLLSAKKSEDIYTARDKDLLRTISLQASAACVGLISRMCKVAESKMLVDHDSIWPLAEEGSPMSKNKVFISYAHDDQNPVNWVRRLEAYLEPLQRRGDFAVWYDGKISAGEEWNKKIEGALGGADVVIFLIGPYFLASKYIMEKEVPLVLAALKSGKLKKMFPITLTYSNYKESEFAIYQAFNKLSGPLEALSKPEQDKVLMDLASAVGEVFKGESG